MTKRGDLTAALRQVSAGQDPEPRPVTELSAVATDAALLTRQQFSRIGKHQISGYFDAAVRKQLKQLALDLDSDNQELLREALNDLFEKHELPPIA